MKVKLDSQRLILIGFLLFSIALVVGSVYWFGPDNVIEEKYEEVIKNRIGLDIDLTPSSKEI